jgi:hypothetical protein
VEVGWRVGSKNELEQANNKANHIPSFSLYEVKKKNLLVVT